MKRTVLVLKFFGLFFALLFSHKLIIGQTLPDGFSVREVNTKKLILAVGFSFIPDGRILQIHKNGPVRVIVDNSSRTDPIFVVPELAKERDLGVLGIAVDPDFPDQPYIYLFHSHISSNNWVSRLTVGGALSDPNSDSLTIDVNSQVPLINDMPWTSNQHVAGTLRFGKDKSLYISHGDNEKSDLVQDLTTLNGKILRINRDGTIPDDNPSFPNEPNGKRPEIFAFGLRNPFRFTMDSKTDQLFIGDVGLDSLEEVDLSMGGENFGWPHYEGNFELDPNAPLIEPTPPTFPIWEYPQVPDESFSVIALVLYRQVDFPNDHSFPDEYNGAFFYSDFSHDWIRYLQSDGEGGWISEDFATGFPSIVDAAVGTDGALYLLEFAGSLKKIIYGIPDGMVGLSHFTAELIGDKVVLTWKIISNSNIIGFAVQRSSDGQNFKDIGLIKTRESPFSEEVYTFEDLELRSGTIFYRLKLTSTDGKIDFSENISVEILPPNEFILSQNYPNPFNLSTKITIKLPQKSLELQQERGATLTIYDILGRDVIKLLDKNMFPGTYTLTWEGKNQNREPVPSGVYLYRLQAGKFVDTKKLILLK